MAAKKEKEKKKYAYIIDENYHPECNPQDPVQLSEEEEEIIDEIIKKNNK